MLYRSVSSPQEGLNGTHLRLKELQKLRTTLNISYNNLNIRYFTKLNFVIKIRALNVVEVIRLLLPDYGQENA